MNLELEGRTALVTGASMHIGRAAAELHLAQPSLSRQIRRLEEQLGVRLFDRTAHGSRLTPAGRAFLVQANELLGAARHAVARVRAAATSGTITIGYMPGLPITPAVRDLRERHPDAEIHTQYLTWEDTRCLAEHRVDVVLAWQPFVFPMEGYRVTVLYEDPRVLVVPTTHRLAGRKSVTLADFADEPLVEFPMPGASAEWRAFWWPERPDGGRRPVGPAVHTVQDKFEVVALGKAVIMHPRSDRSFLTRPDLTSIPIEDFPPCHAVMLTRPVEDNSMVDEFRRSALSCLPPKETAGD